MNIGILIIFCAFVVCPHFLETKADDATNYNFPVDSFASPYQFASENHIASNLATDEYPSHETQHNLGQHVTIVGEKQDVGSSLSSIIGPEAAAYFGLVGTVLGGLAIVGVVMNSQSISSLSTDQDSICTSVQSLGTFTCTVGAIFSQTDLQTCFTSLVSIADPSC